MYNQMLHLLYYNFQLYFVKMISVLKYQSHKQWEISVKLTLL